MDRPIETPLRDSRDPGALDDRQDPVARVHSPDELGRLGARGDGEARDPGSPSGVGIRARGAILFLFGFLLGALALYYLLWRTGGLRSGHFASLTTGDIAGATRIGAPAPIPTFPFPATTREATPRPIGSEAP